MTLLVEIGANLARLLTQTMHPITRGFFDFGAAISHLTTRKNTTKVILILPVPIAHTLPSKPSIAFFNKRLKIKRLFHFMYVSYIVVSMNNVYLHLLECWLRSWFNIQHKNEIKKNKCKSTTSVDRSILTSKSRYQSNKPKTKSIHPLSTIVNDDYLMDVTHRNGMSFTRSNGKKLNVWQLMAYPVSPWKF